MHRFAYLAGFALTSSAGVVFVLLSDLQDRYGLPSWGIGAIASSGFVASLLIQLLLARMVDRGSVLLLGAIALALGVGGSIWFILASTLWPLVAARAMLGLGAGVFDLVARKALVGLDTEGSGARLGSLLSANVAGFLLGPLLGAGLARYGFNAPFVAVGVLTALAAGPALVWLRSAPISVGEPVSGAFGRFLRMPGMQAAMLAQLMVFANIGIFDSVIDRYLTDLGASNEAIGLILLGVGGPLLILPTPAGHWVERYGPRRALVPLMVAVVFSITGFGLVPVIAAVTIAGVFQGTFEAMLFPTTQLLALDETGTEQAAVGQALLGTVGQATAGVTAFAGPVLYEALGARALFAGMGMLALVLAMSAAQRLRSIE